MKLYATVAIFALSCLFGLALSRQRPTEEALARCGDIGRSVGCSGCNNKSTGCEWCSAVSNEGAHPSNQKSSCAPVGNCDLLVTRDGEPMVKSPKLCPSAVGTEGVFHGRDTDPKDALRFSPSFDSYYCEFPQDPWTVDRYANLFLNDDPASSCGLFNSKLYLGRREKIEEFCGIDLDGEREQTCLKLYHSLRCSVACPGYGSVGRFNALCHEECARLEQICDIPSSVELPDGPPQKRGTSAEVSMLDCLDFLAIQSGGGVPYECAEKGESDCQKLNYIEPTGRFDYDYCFFGGKDERCSGGSVDCELRLRADDWGILDTAAICTPIGPPVCPGPNCIPGKRNLWPGFQSDGPDDHEKRVLPPVVSQPGCFYFEDECGLSGCDKRKRSTDSTEVNIGACIPGDEGEAWLGYAFDIVTLPEGDGLSCDEVAQQVLIGSYHASSGFVYCYPEFGVCAATVEQNSHFFPYCSEPADVYEGCTTRQPTVFQGPCTHPTSIFGLP